MVEFFFSPFSHRADDFAWVALKSHSHLARLGYTGSIKERPSHKPSNNPTGHCLSNHRRCRSYHMTGSFRSATPQKSI